MKALKELNRKFKKKISSVERDPIVNQVNQLLLTQHKEDNKVLEDLGLNHQVHYYRDLEQDVNRTKKSQEIYDKSVFTGKDLKDICNKYDLRVLKTRYYNGSIPPELTRKITEFCTKIDMIDKDGNPILRENSFYILAPTEMFNTVKHVPLKKDPILLFKVGSEHGSGWSEAQETDTFVPVHHWGNDFTFLRQFRFLFNSYKWHEEEWSNRGKSQFLGALGLIALIFVIFGHENVKLAFTIGYVVLFIGFSFLYRRHTKKRLKDLWNDTKI